MSILCDLPVISALFSACLAAPPLATGYVEGEFVLSAPIATARIEALEVRRGAHVDAGAVLARMEERDAVIALREAEAALGQAEAQLDNLCEGRRPEEIRVIEAGLASARAQREELSKEYARMASLVGRGVAAEAELDQVRARLDVAAAQVAEAESSLAVARLPAREKEIAAAEAAVEQARARTEAARWQLDRRILTAPVAGRVQEVLRQAGEIAGPAAPVLSLLPDGGVIVRLYVPETEVSRIAVGTELAIACDGCGSDARARIAYISETPEYTPPVIYSLENRQTLVYLVEAEPAAGAEALKPGQIVDARLAE